MVRLRRLTTCNSRFSFVVFFDFSFLGCRSEENSGKVGNKESFWQKSSTGRSRGRGEGAKASHRVELTDVTHPGSRAPPRSHLCHRLLGGTHGAVVQTKAGRDVGKEREVR